MPADMPTVEKKDGSNEPFDDRKFYASILLTCMEQDDPETDCHEIAGAVTAAVAAEIVDRESIMSTELRMLGRDALEEYSKELADEFYVHDFEE